MKRTHAVAALVAIALAATVAIAGPGHKCTSSTQECLDKMVQKFKEVGWAGIDMKKGEDGTVAVKRVYPGTAAESAGLREGDVIVAINGHKLGEKSGEEAKKAEQMVKKSMTPGSQISYTILRNGQEKVVQLTLTKPPEEVIAGWIGAHMMEHAGTAVAQN